MGFFRAYTILTRWQKIIVILSTLFVVYTFMVFFVLPKIVKDISQKKLTEILGRQTTISKIIINPYSFLFILEDLNIQAKNADKSLLTLKQITINFQASSLFKQGPVIKEISVTDPVVHITRNQDGSYNFSDLLPENTGDKDTRQDQQEELSQPLRFFLANIRLQNGEITIEDLQKNTTHALTQMNLAIPFISNMDSLTDIFVTPYFAVHINGSPIILQGKSKPFTDALTTTMEFNLADLELPKYFRYNPVPTQVDLVDGKLSAQLFLNFSTPDKQDSLPRHSLSGNITLSNLEIRGPKDAELFSLAKLHLALADSPILQGTINLDELSISSPKLSLNHDDQGVLNIFKLIPQTEDSEAPEAAVKEDELALQLACKHFSIDDFSVNFREEGKARDIFSLAEFTIDNTTISSAAHEVTLGKMHVDGGNLKLFRLHNGTVNLLALAPVEEQDNAEKLPQPPTDSPQWLARIDDFVLQNFDIQADDLVEQGTGNISLESIALRAQQFSNANNQQADTQLNFTMNQTGIIDVAGKVGITPLQAEIDFGTENIEIVWFQDFIAQAANIVVPEGKITTKGHVSLATTQKTPVKAQLQSDISISDVKVIDSTDNRDLFAFKNLSLENMKVDADPFFVNIQTVSLHEPSINAVVSEDGVLNFSRIAKSDSSNKKVTEPTDKAKDDAAAPFKVDQIIVENGKVAVHDRSISPNFNTTLTKINSKVSSLSSDAKKQPDFNLSAMVNNHTPLKIDGSINPLSTNLFLDIQMLLKDMDLGVFTPYSGKYAGYTIQKGKMTLELDYAINDNRLQASNDVFLDQFDFGKEVKSEDAVNAPVTLAVALLKDPSGRISLDLPVSGNLDDPKFSIGGVVLEMIMNLLVKAATAPFSLLGAMFGGGEDLNILSFEAGTATLVDQELEKVQTLITALTQRPALKLDIGGYVHVERDTQALKRLRLERRLKSEKMKRLISQGSTVTTVEDIQLTDEEYEEFVQAAFAVIPQIPVKSGKESTQTQSENSAIVKNPEKKQNGSAPATREEMIQALIEQINISNDDLRDLAQQRAMVVKDAFILDGGLDAARIQTTMPDTLEPQDKSLDTAGAILTLQ